MSNKAKNIQQNINKLNFHEKPSSIEGIENKSKIFDNRIDSPWMTTKEAAEYLRTSIHNIRKLLFEGKITCYKFGRQNRFHKDELDRLLHPRKVVANVS